LLGADCTQILQCGGYAKKKCSDCALSNFDACPDCGNFCCDSCSCDACGFYCYSCNPDQDDWPERCEDCHETLFAVLVGLNLEVKELNFATGSIDIAIIGAMAVERIEFFKMVKVAAMKCAAATLLPLSSKNDS